LVRRHFTLVYSAAVRRMDGDADRAKDVTQVVFTGLAREAAALSRHPALTGWLYAATRSAAIDILRAERRRRRREEKAHIMEETLSSPERSADWEQLRPVLDEAMDELDARDREAVLLRFFEGRPFVAVGGALRVSEEAARKRVDRALDKLGELLARRGITSTAGALAVLLANQTAVATPAGALASVTSAALAGAAVTAGGVGAAAAGLFIMSTSKVVTGISVAAAVIAVGSAIYQANLARDSVAELDSLGRERTTLRAQLGTMAKRAETVDGQLAAARKELGDLRAAVPQPAPAKTAVRHTQGAAMDHVLEHPEMHAPFVEQQALRIKARYERFLATSGLSAEQQERFLREMKEGAAGELDVMAALHAQGYGVGNLPQDLGARKQMQQLITEKQQAFRTRLSEVLGEDGLKQFAQYSNTIPERNVADQLAGQLYTTAEPLTAQQANQLAQVLAQHRFAPQSTPSPSTTLNGTFVDPLMFKRRMAQAMQQGGMTLLDWAAPVTDAALARAKTVLSPAQYTALQRVQAQQVTQFQLAPTPPGMREPATGGK
ncbi:MAG: sigma-70 family RNA polymerase sigma factor, partial [Verrucomicrobiota bacterium]